MVPEWGGGGQLAPALLPGGGGQGGQYCPTKLTTRKRELELQETFLWLKFSVLLNKITFLEIQRKNVFCLSKNTIQVSIYEKHISFYYKQILSRSGTKKFIKSIVTKWKRLIYRKFLFNFLLIVTQLKFLL